MIKIFAMLQKFWYSNSSNDFT